MEKNKLSKKILVTIAVIALTFGLGFGMLSLTPNTSGGIRQVSAATTVSAKEDFKYEIVGGNVTITGIRQEVLDDYQNQYSSVDLRIPSAIDGNPVTIIAAGAFKGWTRLTSVTIPESITTIGNQAFYGTTYLTEIYYKATSVANFVSGSETFYNAGKDGIGITVNIGENVARIPDYFFYISSTAYAPKITTLNFEAESALESIGNYAFYNAISLTSVTIPSGSIGNYAFYNCTALQTLTISSDVTTIGTQAFYGVTALTTINYNAKSVANLASGSNAFYNAGKSGTGITLNIGENVTKIPNYLFYISSTAYAPKITTLNFEAGSALESIGNYAFYNATSLTSATIPSGTIGDYAFYNAISLTSVTITSGSIGNNAFNNCTALNTLTISSNVTMIGTQAFYGTNLLKTINYNATNLTDLTSSSNAFYYAGRNGTGITLNIGENVTKIPAFLFYTGSTAYAPQITKVNFEEESLCASIGNYAFSYCTKITSINIPNSVKNIGAFTFYYCSGFINISIPSGVEVIGQAAFSYCVGLTSLTIPSNVTSIGGAAFQGCYGLKNVTNQANITNIASSMFDGCYGLTSITIPSSVKTIDTYAFQNCYGLTSITIPSSVQTINSYAFQSCYGLKNLTIPTGLNVISSYAFNNCYGLKSLHISSSVTSIGIYAFAKCNDLENITVDAANTVFRAEGNCIIQTSSKALVVGCKASIIPASVTSIASYAFADCVSLTNIDIPDTVTSISTYAFQGCTGLKSIRLSKELTVINNYTFYNCTSLLNIEIPGKVQTISNYAFQNCTGLKSIILPESLTSIGSYAFSYCKSLNNVTIPTKVTTLNSYVFEYCSGLTNIDLNKVTNIGSYAFQNCTSLESIILPESVTVINANAFQYCTSLTTIKIPSKVIAISNYTFQGCTNLKSISIPDNLTNIGAYAFYNCGKLTSIRIPSKVTTIGSQAFYNCTGLTSIALPVSVTSIAGNAFYNCSSLTIYAEVEEGLQPSGWNLNWNPSNRPVVWGFKSTGITVTLDYNYSYAEGNGSEAVEFNAAYQFETPTRKYYSFVGWFSEPNGGVQYTGADGIGLNIWSEPETRTLYAKWELIPVDYNVTATIVGEGSSLENATFTIVNESGEPTSTITMFQKGYLNVYINEGYAGEAFIRWEVQRNDSNAFDSLGYGSNVLPGRNAEQKLDLFSNNVYLINEAFLDKYLQSNGSIVFKAVYANDEPKTVTIETASGQRSYGKVEIDGIAVLFDENGKIVSSYTGDATETTTIKITPNKYRAVDKVQISTDNGATWDDLTADLGSSNNYTIQVSSESLWVKITYKSLTYDIEVKAMTTGEERVDGAVVDGATGKIGLEAPLDVFNASLNTMMTGYRIIANSINNIKIYNYQTSSYDYFHATNGRINLAINEATLDKYMRNGKIEVIAIYVKQYELLIDVINPELGSISVTVKEPNGNDRESTTRYYDEGCIVTIIVDANEGSSITDTEDIKPGEELYKDQLFVLTLNEDRAIKITFGKKQYAINAKAVNINNEVIKSLTVTSTKTEVNFLGDFSVQMDSSVDYRFVGWYIKIGNEYRMYRDRDENLYDILIDEDFILNWADGYEVNIVARFMPRFIADISETIGGSSTIGIMDGSKETVDGINNMYKENTVLKISFTSDNEFYYLDGIDGLYPTETIVYDDETHESGYVIITVDGYRVISLNFVPRIFVVTSKNNLSNASGKINVLTTKLSVGDKVVITFDADSGFEITNWKINGMTVAEINSLYSDANAVRDGNAITFTVTRGWLEDHGSKLNNTVTTTINSSYLMIIIVALVLIPLLLIGILLMLRANKKRKTAYAEAMVIRDQRIKGLNMGSMVEQLRKGTYKANPSEEGKK